MHFPIVFGHMTFASHRCWAIFITEAVFFAVEAWRRRYGKSARHTSKEDGGHETLRFSRVGMDDYILVGWRARPVAESGHVLYEAPDGTTCDNLCAAFEYDMAQKSALTGGERQKEAVCFLQRFLNTAGDEAREERAGDDRVRVTTGTLED